MGFLAIWIICAIVGAAAAGSRNRSAGAWFIICLVFGLFGLAALFLMDPLPGPPEIAASDARACPHCAETIKKAANVCKHCGRDVPQAEGYGPVPVFQAKPLPAGPVPAPGDQAGWEEWRRQQAESDAGKG